MADANGSGEDHMANTNEMQRSDGSEEVRERAVRKLGELLKSVKFAMMTTVGEDGILRSRPMTAQQQEFDGTLWFFAGLSTDLAEEVHRNGQINLSYSEPGEMRFVSVSGTAEVLRERDKMRERWSDLYSAWFPHGLDDPDLCLLKVEVSHAEYWDSPSGKMAKMAGFSKAARVKKQAEGVVEEHGEVELEPKARGAAASLSGASEDASDEIESHT